MYKKKYKSNTTVLSLSPLNSTNIFSVWMYGRVRVYVILLRFAVIDGSKESLYS